MNDHLPPVAPAPRGISQIHYSVLSASDICQQSVLQCQSRRSLRTKEFGLNDRRLGVCGRGDKCQTCGHSFEDCIGHPGHITLPMPVFHPGFFAFTLRVMRAICKTCSYVLLTEEEKAYYARKLSSDKMDNVQRMALLKSVQAEAAKQRVCPRCSSLNGTVKRQIPLRMVHEKYAPGLVKRGESNEEFLSFIDSLSTASAMNPEVAAYKHNAQEVLDPLKVKQLLAAVSPEDKIFLGFQDGGNCSDLVISVLYIPPCCVRPSVPSLIMGTRDDDLTYLYMDILNVCDLLRGDDSTVDAARTVELWEMLQLRVTRLLDTSLPGYPHTSKLPPTRSFSQRVSGKHGRFRSNLSGKRVNFSGRSVISPDPNLDIDEVAIPLKVAMRLTYSERVYAQNLPHLRQLALNGPEKHPGANYIIFKDGTKKNLYHDREAWAKRLRVGDIVERHLVDGDLLLFNRQPSLHRLSMMCHRARVLPHRTLRFNECCCAPYNADFDGDEMNIHFVQTEEARAEARTLMATVKNIISPRNGDPIIACTQDFLTAAFLLTSRDTFMTRGQVAQFCAAWSKTGELYDLPPPAILKPEELWTGKQAIDILITPIIEKKARSKKSSSQQLGGEKSSKKSIHSNQAGKKGNVVQQQQQAELLSFNKLSFEATAKSYTGKGIGALCPEEGFIAFSESNLLCGRLDKKLLGGGAKDGLFAHAVHTSGPEHAAAIMNRIARGTSRWLMDYGFSLGLGDVCTTAKLTKSKNDLITAAFVECDQLITDAKEGRLAPNPGQTVPQTLEARLNSKLSDVRSQCGDAAVGVLTSDNVPLTMAVSGSKGSNLNIAQMMACVGQQTVRGKRIQHGFANRTLPHFPRFAEDPGARGFVASSFYTGLVPTEFFFHTMAGREGLVDTAVKTAETGYIYRRLMKAMEDLSVQYDGTVRNTKGDIIQQHYGDDQLDPLQMEGLNSEPVAPAALWLFVKNIPLQTKSELGSDAPLLSPPALTERVQSILSSAPFQPTSHRFKTDLADFWAARAKELTKLFTLHQLPIPVVTSKDAVEAARQASAMKWIKQQLDATEPRLQLFFRIALRKYIKKKCEPGTPCGALAAQSVGEPSTQMTLRTFHFAGVASMSITQGVPRLAEVINATKNIATPICTAPLLSTDAITAAVTRGQIERLQLKEIVSEVTEIIQPTCCFLRFKVNLKLAAELHLDITTESIVKMILKQAKATMMVSPLKLLHEGLVKVHDLEHFDVYPFHHERGKMLFTLKRLLALLKDITVFGIPGIRRALVSLQKGSKTKLQILAEGADLRSVMGLSSVDGQRTTCNHVGVIERVLGIEAARAMIVHEIREVMNAYSLGIDTRHLYLLADVMTHRGSVLGITRVGMEKMNPGILTMASFERTTEHLYAAAIHHSADKTLSVSESIIVGEPVQLGTNSFKIFQAKDPVKKSGLKAMSTTSTAQPTLHRRTQSTSCGNNADALSSSPSSIPKVLKKESAFPFPAWSARGYKTILERASEATEGSYHFSK